MFNSAEPKWIEIDLRPFLKGAKWAATGLVLCGVIAAMLIAPLPSGKSAPRTALDLERVRSSLVATASASSLTVLEMEQAVTITERGGMGDGATLRLRVPCRIWFCLDLHDLRATDLQWNANQNILVARLPPTSIHVEPRLDCMQESRESAFHLHRRQKTWDGLRQSGLARLKAAAVNQSQWAFPAASGRRRAEMARLLRTVLTSMDSRAAFRVE